MAMMKVRKLKKMETGTADPINDERTVPPAASAEEGQLPGGLVFVTGKKPAPEGKIAREAPPPKGPGPTACEKTTPSGDAAKEVPPQNEKRATPPVDLSAPRAEFSLRIGSLERAQESIVNSYMTMVLWPMMFILIVILKLMAQDTDGARALVNSAEFILGVAVVLGPPMMAVSWFHGLYPKGSCGRFVSGSMLAFLLGLWLVLVLVASNLQNALADSGAALRLNWLLLLICTSPVFIFGGAVSEFMDDRAAWRKKMGAKVKEVRLDLRNRFVDFDHQVGTFGKGNSAARMAYLEFLVVPTIMLVGTDYVLRGMVLEAKDVIVASVNSMFVIVIAFGAAMVIARFLRGFYPCGSLSRAVFGVASVPVLILFAWEILIGSGIENVLEQNHFIIDMSLVMLPVLMYVMFFAVFELSELRDCRRAYRMSVGLPVEPHAPGEFYNRYDDFNPFYASFVTGTKKGRIILYKYAVEILIITILVAVGISVYQSPTSENLNETVRSYLSPRELDDRMDHMVFVLLILAVLNTAWSFLAWSYREGSFSRLVMSGIVALVASQWAYSFWSSLAKIIQSKLATEIINYAMFAAFGFIMLRAVREVYKGYLKSRNGYLDWRLAMLRDEAHINDAPAIPTTFSSTAVSSGKLNGRGV